MANIPRHGKRSQQITPHPVARYADRVQLIRWRRGPMNSTWEARVRLPDGVWTQPFSLRTQDETTAALNAVEELSKKEQLQASGLPQPSRTREAARPACRGDTFGAAAQPVIERLAAQRDEVKAREGRQKANKFDQHLGRIQNLLVPAFGDTPVAEISGSRLNDWIRAFRVPDRRGATKAPSQSTVGSINHSFQLVMRAAVERGWIRADDVPTISKRGFDPSLPNAWFTAQEIERLRDHMSPVWTETAHRALSRELKKLLRAYIGQQHT